MHMVLEATANSIVELETFYYPNKDIWPGSMLEFVQPTDPVDRYVFDKPSNYLPSGFMIQG